VLDSGTGLDPALVRRKINARFSSVKVIDARGAEFQAPGEPEAPTRPTGRHRF